MSRAGAIGAQWWANRCIGQKYGHTYLRTDWRTTIMFITFVNNYNFIYIYIFWYLNIIDLFCFCWGLGTRLQPELGAWIPTQYLPRFSSRFRLSEGRTEKLKKGGRNWGDRILIKMIKIDKYGSLQHITP